jgi:hypothetical protein
MDLDRTLWIGAALVTTGVGANYAFLAAYMWVLSRYALGPPRSDTQQALQSLLDVSRQSEWLTWGRLVLLYGGLGAIVIALSAREWLGLVIAAGPFSLLWWMKIRTTIAPVALLLGTSTHSSIRRQREVKRRLSPLRVVSLLDVDVPWDPGLADEMALDCFRTTNEDDWWPVIAHLMDIAPVIAIDTGAETAGVLREGKHILDAELAHKCLFLTPPNGSAPILDRLRPASKLDRRALRFARYEEAPAVIAAMVAEIAGRRAGEVRRHE